MPGDRVTTVSRIPGKAKPMTASNPSAAANSNSGRIDRRDQRPANQAPMAIPPMNAVSTTALARVVEPRTFRSSRPHSTS